MANANNATHFYNWTDEEKNTIKNMVFVFKFICSNWLRFSIKLKNCAPTIKIAMFHTILDLTALLQFEYHFILMCTFHLALYTRAIPLLGYVQKDEKKK